MNWLLILVILLIAGNIVWGIYRGFLRVIYSMIAWILILVFVTWATPFVSEVLSEYTRLDERIEAGVEERLHTLVRGEEPDAKEGQETAGENAGEEASPGAQAKPGSDDIGELGIKLPKVIADKLLDTGAAADQLLDGAGVYAKASGQASSLAMRGISFVLVLLIAVIAFHILATVLDLVAKLPVIGEVNHFLGGFAGLIKGVLLVWLFFAFVAMGSATSVGTGMIGLIYESEYLVWLYENNLVLSILMIFL